MPFFLTIFQTIYSITHKCSLSTSNSNKEEIEKHFETRMYNENNTKSFIKDIKNQNWEGKFHCDNPQDSFNHFWEFFINIVTIKTFQ